MRREQESLKKLSVFFLQNNLFTIILPNIIFKKTLKSAGKEDLSFLTPNKFNCIMKQLGLFSPKILAPELGGGLTAL